MTVVFILAGWVILSGLLAYGIGKTINHANHYELGGHHDRCACDRT